MQKFTVEIRNQLNPVTASQWCHLFPDSPNTFETIALLQRSGVKEFQFYSILVRFEHRPVLLLPLFKTDHYLGSTLEANLKKTADMIDGFMPRLLRMPLLRVGIVDQQWGEVGFCRDLPKNDLALAWDLALKALDIFCDAEGIQILAFTEFTPESGSMLPLDKLSDFVIADGAPFIQIPVDFPSVDAYLMSLPKDTRHFLRRSCRKSQPVETIRTRDPQVWLDSIYELYLKQVARSELNLNGTQNKSYFADACQVDPSAEYFLYVLNGQLIGFELLCRLPNCLLSKFVAIDEGPGREHNLYFRSWMDIVTYCIDNEIPTIDLGCTGKELKTKLGKAKIIASFVMFKHRNPLFNRLFKHLKYELAYESKVPVPPSALGLGWTLKEQIGDQGAQLSLSESPEALVAN
jgi:hypothetical protein